VTCPHDRVFPSEEQDKDVDDNCEYESKATCTVGSHTNMATLYLYSPY